jgi:nucleoid-associated protein YgaU
MAMKHMIGWALAVILCMGLAVGCDNKKEDVSAAPPEMSQPPMFPEESVPLAEPAPAPAPVDVAAEPAPAPAPAPKESYAKPKAPRTYVVQKGDTLQKISDKFYGTNHKWKKIQQANKGVDPKKLQVGTKLTIPD